MLDSLFYGYSIWSIALSLAIIVATYLAYNKFYKPYKQFLFYKKMLIPQYKTLVHPYSMLGLGTFGIYKNDYKRYGDSQYTIKHVYPKYQISLCCLGGKPFLDLIDHQLIKQFYEKQGEGYYNKSLSNPFSNSMKSLIGNGLIFSQGNQWKMKKKIMSNVFNYEFIKSKIHLIAKIANQKIQQIQSSQTTKDEKEVRIDVSNLLQRIFGNVVVKCFFGDMQLSNIEGVQIFTYINSMFEKNTDRVISLFTFLLGPQFYKYNIRAVDKQITHQSAKFKEFSREEVMRQIMISRTLKEVKHFDSVIELLVKQDKLKDSISNEKQALSKDFYTIEDLVDEFITFFTAGTDTTSNATSILIYLLAQNPHVQQKLRAQINAHFKSPLQVKDITYQSLKKLTYLDDVFKQTLRMYGPNAGLFLRVAVKDHYLGKIPIKKGTFVSLKIKANHFKQQFYEHPHVFNPDRWSQKDPSKTHPFSFFPFSSGQRGCIGQHLAQIQSKIAVIFLLKRYSKIILQKPEFKKYMRTLYAAQQMTTTFIKEPIN